MSKKKWKVVEEEVGLEEEGGGDVEGDVIGEGERVGGWSGEIEGFEKIIDKWKVRIEVKGKKMKGRSWGGEKRRELG